MLLPNNDATLDPDVLPLLWLLLTYILTHMTVVHDFNTLPLCSCISEKLTCGLFFQLKQKTSPKSSRDLHF